MYTLLGIAACFTVVLLSIGYVWGYASRAKMHAATFGLTLLFLGAMILYGLFCWKVLP